MSALANINNSQIETGSVAAISTNARIDYILRFSKQAVLVIDELSANYSHIGNLFVGSLSDDHNAAYISVSAKLDDIQIRCRLIEQLFSDVLFDPEQSLAVSILRLAKGSSQPISVIIDHAQYLSFKLIHELCYLSEISKKAKLNISVVLLGNKQTGVKISAEKGLFAKRLAIIEAETGQLLNLENKIFKLSNGNFFRKHLVKIIMLLVFIIGVIAVAMFFLQPRDLFSFSALPSSDKVLLNEKLVDTKKAANKVIFEQHKPEKNNVAALDNLTKVTKKNIQASANEIFFALKNDTNSQKKLPLQIATPLDIFTAIENPTEKTIEVNSKAAGKIKNQPLTKNPAIKKQDVIAKVNVVQDKRYLLQSEPGYIIQLAGFTNQLEFNQLKDEFSVINYATYKRLLNDKDFFVVTSLRYSTKALALAAINKLPKVLQSREPWVKSIAAVKLEIEKYQRSIK